MPTMTMTRPAPTAQDDRLSLAFAALADPTRRDMLARLAVGDASVGQLAAPYSMSVQAISKHVAVLERAGLVSRGQDNPAGGDTRRRPVHVEFDALEPVTNWLERYRQAAEDRYSRLDALLAQEETTQ